MSIIDQRKEALAKKILESVDVVQLVSTFDPDERNQGEYAYSPDMQALIKEAKELRDIEDGDAPLLRVRLNGETDPIDIDNGDVDVYVDLPEDPECGIDDRIQVKCTYEGLIIDIFREGELRGTSAQTWNELYEKLLDL